MKDQGRPEEEIAAQREKIKQTSSDIDSFCRETGRARHRDREGVYTRREFPDADKYDVSKFEHQQKDAIDKYFSNGGAQQGYTFGEMTANVPIIPAVPAPVATTPNPETMTYGNAFDYTGNRKAQREQFADAKATLTGSPEITRKTWSRVADDLKAPSVGETNGACYEPYYKRVKFHTYKEAFAESSYQRKNVVFFHEYGHNIDNLLGGGKGRGNYISVLFNNGAFGSSIRAECEEAIRSFATQKGMTEPLSDKTVGKAFIKWVKETFTIYERSDISDMFEEYLTDTYGNSLQFPFGAGHGYSYYHSGRTGATATEAFAEMFSATVTGNDSLPVIKQFFPKSYQIFLDMLESVTK